MTAAVSDGTVRCPVPSPDGQPCQRTIPAGWTADEGHPGGHWWESDEHRAFMDTAHYDATLALSGQPFTPHAPEDCPGMPTCFTFSDGTVITKEGGWSL